MLALKREQEEVEGRRAEASDPDERAALGEEIDRLSKERKEIGPDLSNWARKAKALSDDHNKS
jgi:hypothetical protein